MPISPSYNASAPTSRATSPLISTGPPRSPQNCENPDPQTAFQCYTGSNHLEEVRVASSALLPAQPAFAPVRGWCPPSTYSRGDILFRQGDPASSLFLVDSGLVRVTSQLADRREVVLRVVRAGGLVGDRVLLGDTTRDATAEVLSPAAIQEIAADDFLERSRLSPDLWNWFTTQLERRIHDVEQRLHLISFYRVRQRLMLVLADLAESFPGPHPIVPLTQSDLAQLVGATRETASTALNDLEREHCVRLGRGSVQVFDAERLRSLAYGEPA
ncbi:MAG: Crp/Fnr family transcriptional regulator [Bryobacteraceae bacterium]